MDLILDEQKLATVVEDDIKYFFKEALTMFDISSTSLETITEKVWNVVRTWIDFETDYDIGREYDNKEEFEKWFDSLVAQYYIEELKKYIKKLFTN
jgi:hypothetical protein